jgi:hypothetical protein
VANRYINQGLVAIAATCAGETTPNYSLNKAHSGIRHFYSLDFSIDPSTSPLRHSQCLVSSPFS